MRAGLGLLGFTVHGFQGGLGLLDYEVEHTGLQVFLVKNNYTIWVFGCATWFTVLCGIES